MTVQANFAMTHIGLANHHSILSTEMFYLDGICWMWLQWLWQQNNNNNHNDKLDDHDFVKQDEEGGLAVVAITQ